MPAKMLPPGPKGRFLTGHLADLRRDVLALYTRCCMEFGDVSTVRFGMRRVWLLSRPELIERVLADRSFVKHYALRMNRRLLGDGLLSSEGDLWLRQRRLMQPAFLRERLADYGAVMVRYTDNMLGRWDDGAKLELHSEMRRLTMEITAKTLFGADVEGQGPAVAEALREVMESFMSRLFSVFRFSEYLPTPKNLRARRAVERLDAILYGLIAKSRAEGGRDSLLSILLHARDDQDGTGMTDKQLRDEAMTLFLAGHETTALALTYTLRLLALHPDIQSRLRDEAVSRAGGRELTADDYPGLPFARNVVLEGMRLFPPAYVIGRQASNPCELGGYAIPRGGTVLMPQWVMHRHPKYWDEPERFHPDRWQGGLLERIPKGVYFPFGGGPRVCIGNTFAMMEATLVLATICRRHRLEPVGDMPLSFRPRMTLAPAGPVEVVVRRG